jgi:hypothetical protein
MKKLGWAVGIEGFLTLRARFRPVETGNASIDSDGAPGSVSARCCVCLRLRCSK